MSAMDQIEACPHVALQRWGQLDVLQIERNDCTASVALWGGQLLRFQAKGQEPLLWPNPHADYSGTTAIREGIPICWPWFNKLGQNHRLVQDNFADIEAPSHGLVRNRLWQLEAVSDDATATHVHLCTVLEEKPLKLEVIYRFSDQVTIELISTNLSDDKMCFAQALHTYFAISDIADVRVQGLDSYEYLDMIDGHILKVQQGDVRVSEEVDRLYMQVPSEIKLVDAGWQRSIYLNSKNSRSTVIWNPWVEKSKGLSQFADEDYQRMICIETARAGVDFVDLAGGQQHKLTLTLSVAGEY